MTLALTFLMIVWSWFEGRHSVRNLAWMFFGGRCYVYFLLSQFRKAIKILPFPYVSFFLTVLFPRRAHHKRDSNIKPHYMHYLYFLLGGRSMLQCRSYVTGSYIFIVETELVIYQTCFLKIRFHWDKTYKWIFSAEVFHCVGIILIEILHDLIV